MDLYYKCNSCSEEDVWRIRIHGTRPMARTMIGAVSCPGCGGPMLETGFEDLYNVHDLRGKFVAAK